MRAADSSNPAADAAMERYADGDESAFGDLYDALAPRLTAFFSRKLRDPALVADVLQETMLRIHCARGRFIKGSWVTPWAFTIARHLLFDRTRRKKLEHLTADGNADLEHPSILPGPEDLARSQQGIAAIMREVLRLPDTQREVFELVHYTDMSYAEVAETLGVTVASVKLRLQRANQTLRATFAPQE